MEITKPSDWNTRNKYYYVLGRDTNVLKTTCVYGQARRQRNEQTHTHHVLLTTESRVSLALNHTLTHTHATEREHAKEEAMKWNELNGPFFFFSLFVHSFFINFYFIYHYSCLRVRVLFPVFFFFFHLSYVPLRGAFVHSFACLVSWEKREKKNDTKKNNNVKLQNTAVQFILSLDNIYSFFVRTTWRRRRETHTLGHISSPKY